VAHHHLLVIVQKRLLTFELLLIVASVGHLLVHAHAFLVFDIALLASHIASLTYETGAVLLMLLHDPLAKDVATLTFILLISYCLVDGMSVIILAAWRHQNVLLILVVYRLLLILQQSLRSRVGRVSGELSPSLLRIVD